jgi:AcrR family transcriptional regulator
VAGPGIMVEKRKNTVFRQNQIVVAAAELIVRYGSEHLTIKRLARRTKLSEAAIYRHFSSKKDIFHFLLRHVEITLLTDFKIGNSRNAGGPSAIDSLIERHISSIEKSRGVEFQVIAEIISMGDASLNRETFRIINSYIAGLEDIFHRRIKLKYSNGKLETEGQALAFFTLLQGLVNMWALSGYAFDLKRRFYQVWSVYKYALDHYIDPITLAEGPNIKYSRNGERGG